MLSDNIVAAHSVLWACNFVTVTDEPSHDVARYMEAIHGREQRAQAVVDMNTRLTAMLGIVGKLLVP